MLAPYTDATQAEYLIEAALFLPLIKNDRFFRVVFVFFFLLIEATSSRRNFHHGHQNNKDNEHTDAKED